MGAGRGRKTAIILIVVILVVILLGAGALLLLRGTLFGGVEALVEDGVQQAQAQPTAAPTVDVIVAGRDIPRGSLITADDLDVMSWPVIDDAPPPLGVLVVSGEGQAGLDQAAGKVARVDILTGQPVLDTMLTALGNAEDLADLGSDAALLIPPGRVAIAVPITRLSSVAYAPREGDHVDILMSFRFMDVDQEFQTELPNNAVIVQQTVDPETGEESISLQRYPMGREERGLFGTTIMVVPGDGEKAVQQTTQLVIDNAVVLRMGNWPLSDLNQPIVVTAVPTAAPDAAAEGDPAQAQPTPVPAITVPDIVTLVMTRQDALVMKYAVEQGALIDLVLRSAADDDIEDIVTDPVTLSYIINARNVTPPEKLPIALDPRIDLLNDLGSQTPPAPPEPGADS